jgi:hypothetical protein
MDTRDLVSIGDVDRKHFWNLTVLNSRVKSRQDAPVDDRRMTLHGVLHGDDNASQFCRSRVASCLRFRRVI